MNINLTLLFQMVFFAFFVWFTKKYVWVPIIGVLNERKTKIADGLAAAEKGVKAEEIGHQKAEKLIAEAKARANEIIAVAEKRGNEIVESARRGRARKARGSSIRHARRSTASSTRRARSCAAKVSSLAVAGAQKILAREIDASAHGEMLDKLAREL
ncbi:MAG: F0F1 ATP synthase subunit B [Gammaproteobacteria bacterium]|nr:F0F1 ATP synthase subunit B [Gammaproteobacteria bacterium]